MSTYGPDRTGPEAHSEQDPVRQLGANRAERAFVSPMVCSQLQLTRRGLGCSYRPGQVQGRQGVWIRSAARRIEVTGDRPPI